jgi:hypothetical protein
MTTLAGGVDGEVLHGRRHLGEVLAVADKRSRHVRKRYSTVCITVPTTSARAVLLCRPLNCADQTCMRVKLQILYENIKYVFFLVEQALLMGVNCGAICRPHRQVAESFNCCSQCRRQPWECRITGSFPPPSSSCINPQILSCRR